MTEEKDIWAEKPNEKDPKYSMHGINPSTGLREWNSVHYLSDMDAWLEKLKTRHDTLRSFKVDTEIMHRKLKAIETWLTKAKVQGYISISQGEKLDEILEAEA